MKIAFIVLSVICALSGVYIATDGGGWIIAAPLISGTLLSAFAASVLHGFDRQVAATKELHAAIIALANGEQTAPLDRLSKDKEIPEHILREKQKDEMLGRTIFKPKP